MHQNQYSEAKILTKKNSFQIFNNSYLIPNVQFAAIFSSTLTNWRRRASLRRLRRIFSCLRSTASLMYITSSSIKSLENEEGGRTKFIFYISNRTIKTTNDFFPPHNCYFILTSKHHDLLIPKHWRQRREHQPLHNAVMVQSIYTKPLVMLQPLMICHFGRLLMNRERSCEELALIRSEQFKDVGCNGAEDDLLQWLVF